MLRRVHGTFYMKQIISELLATRDEPSAEELNIPGEIETGTAYAPSLEPVKDEFADCFTAPNWTTRYGPLVQSAACSVLDLATFRTAKIARSSASAQPGRPKPLGKFGPIVDP